MKKLFFRKPLNKNEDKSFTFLPKYNKNSYLIEGAQIISSKQTSDTDVEHFVIENFKMLDYQFRG